MYQCVIPRMNIIFSKHSLIKLGHRSISQEKTIQALQYPDYIFPSYSGRKTAYKKFGKIYLKVIFKREKGDIIVITQHWDKEFKPPKGI